MMRLEVKLNKAGEVVRFMVNCSTELDELVQVACAGTANKTEEGWSIPADPTLLRRISAEYPGFSISSRLSRHLLELKGRQQAVFDASLSVEPTGTGKPLYPFQNASVRVLDEAGSLIIGHEMGLGKTNIACRAIEYLGLNRCIILAPASVKWSWVKHLQEWGDIDNIVVLDTGSEKSPVEGVRIIARKREQKIKEVLDSKENVCIVSGYELIRSHLELLECYDFDVMIIDEAHRAKNRKAQLTKSLQSLSRRCARRWLFTGTLVRNCYTDVFAPLSIVNPIRFSSFWNFVKIYIETVPNRFGGVDILGLKNKEEFNAMLSVYTYALKKEEVMKDLPKKIYTVYPLQLNTKQEKIYKQMEKEFIAELQDDVEMAAPTTIAKLIRLRQICLTPALLKSPDDPLLTGPNDSAKLDTLNDIIEQLIGEERRFIIFTYFRSFIPYVEEILKEKGVRYGTIVGGQGARERAQVQEDLTKGDINAIIGTAQSMGEGMNLQAADTAVFCDLDWVPANNMQAEARIHRGDIVNCPHIIKLTHMNTVEQDILETIERKERIKDESMGHVEIIRNMLRRTQEVK